MENPTITRSSRPAGDNNSKLTRTEPQPQAHPQLEGSPLSQLSDCLQRATDFGENYNGQGEPFFQASCGEASYSEADGGWRLLHFGAESSAGEHPLSCVAILKQTKGNVEVLPPLELLQSLLVPEELCYMLEHRTAKDNQHGRCVCKTRFGNVIDVTNLLSEATQFNQQAQYLLTEVAKTSSQPQELWNIEEYQGWMVQKQQPTYGQHLSKEDGSNNTLAEDGVTAPACSSSASSVVTASSSTFNVANRLLAGVKGYVASLQASDKEQQDTSACPKERKRKLTHVSFANEKQEEETAEPRQLRSRDGNQQQQQQQQKENVRVVSPPAMELSSESDITTDDEHHKDEEDKHASEDEEYKEEDNSVHEEDDDDILATETVKEPAEQRQHYQTRRRSAATEPPASQPNDDPKRMSTRFGGKRKRDTAGKEEANPPKKEKVIPLCDGPRIRNVKVKVKGMKSLGMLEAVIGKDGIPERRQTRGSHGIHIEAPRRFIEVDSNEGFPSSFHPYVQTPTDQSAAASVFRGKKEKPATSVTRSHRRAKSKVQENPEPESSPVRRSSRARTCRASSYEEPGEDEIDQMEEEVIQAEAEDEEEAQQTVPFVLDTTNKLSATRLASEYEDVCVKQHGTCVSLKGFSFDDGNAKEAVSTLLEECEDLNSKYNRAEEDEDIVAERQLAGRSMRTIQGRMDQEIIARMKEKEQAELLAIEMAYQRKNKKKHSMTINEIEWEEIQYRPVHFVASKPRSNSRTNGSSSCPCAPKSTRTRSGAPSTSVEEASPCALCLDPDEADDSKSRVIQDKNMVPRFRVIDVDAPDFVDRDLDEEEVEKKKAVEKEGKPTRKTRGANRLRNDPQARQETTAKLYELKHSMDFIEKYNSGLIQEKLKDGRK